MTSVLLSTPVIWIAPLTLPHNRRLSERDLMVIVAKAWDSVVVTERSIMLYWQFNIDADEAGCGEDWGRV